MTERVVGIVGIGTMGLPMARNLLRAGFRLVVWNRTPARCTPLVALGAEQAESIDALCARADIVLLALLDGAAIDAVLGRGTPAFRRRVANRTLVLVGTTSPAYSRALEAGILAGAGRYVEAPVSGSRGPAEQGTLIGMVAGATAVVDSVLPLLRPLCRRVFRCGAIPDALRLKLAVNHYLIGMVTVLAEAMQVARASGIDPGLMQAVLNAGPMASEVSRGKLAKLVAADPTPQASIRDVATIVGLVETQARGARVDAPIIRACGLLFRRALHAGHGGHDMVSVLDAVRPLAGEVTP